MYRMLPSYARSSAFDFSFISQSSMPKSLSDSTLVFPTRFVWDKMSQSRLLVCPYFPSSKWSCNMRLVIIFNPPNAISKHYLEISCVNHSSLLMNDGPQNNLSPRNLLQSSLEDSRNSKRLW